MQQNASHTRRDFLQGRAASRALADRATAWARQTASVIGGPEPVVEPPALHLIATRRAMACDFQVQYHGDVDGRTTGAMIEALDLIERLEDQMTLFRDSSEVLAINAHAVQGPVRVESRLFGLLQVAERLFHETEGAFDITSGPLSQVWGFRDNSGKMPTEEEIAEAQRLVGFDCVKLDSEEQTIELRRARAEINLHAIGKGYALDRAAQQLKEQQMTDFLWQGGRSSVLARGENRAGPSSPTDVSNGQGAGNFDGARRGWTVGLRHPLKPARRLAEFHLHDEALATSGSATQYFGQQGKRYGHLIDPRTGWPTTGICTATVSAPSAAEADALSTAFYIMGVEKAHAYCAHHPEIKALLVSWEEEGCKIRLDACGMHARDWGRFD